jgi:uncharacterized protein involved in exopolysaccharide biosynthesis
MGATHLDADGRTTASREALPQQAELDLFRVWDILWRGRWMIITVTAACAVGTAIYALLAPPWYQAEVLLAPAKQKSTLGLTGELGSLAALAGLGLEETDSVEAIAVLKSRDFARAFIEEQSLLPILFEKKWDASTQRWKRDRPPDLRRAVELFDRKVRKVREDRRTGLVTLSVEWKDAKLAAAWANTLANRLNNHMRQRALAEAETNARYLRKELESTSVVVLQQSISRLLEREMEKVMLARGSAEFAFRIVDRADVPRLRSKPKRTLLVVIAVLLGTMVSVVVVLMRDAIRERARVRQALQSHSV